MQIYQIDTNRFAIGSTNKLATYVVEKKGKNYVGVRGRRPLLTKGRFSVVKGNAQLKAAFA